MTKAEMNRRLATLTGQQIRDILRMIREGYGGHGISLEYPATVKQINAVFALREHGYDLGGRDDMDIETAKAICTYARSTGTLSISDDQRARFDAASEAKHQWAMANEYGYARKYHEMYHRMARDLGRLDLLAK